MYRVLLVDDEESVLKVLKTSIDWLALGVDTPVTAADGVQALEAMERSPFHLLIADIKMPRMGGLELIRRVRQLYPETRCILLTAYSEFDYAKEAIRLGVENYLLKPVQKEELESTVQNAMANLYRHRSNGEDLLYQNILSRWLNGAISGEELSERAGVLGFNLFLPQYCAVGILKRSARQQANKAAHRRDGTIICGAYLLGTHMANYGEPEKALMAYNMGPGGAAQAWAAGITSTEYSAKVMEAMDRWEAVLG